MKAPDFSLPDKDGTMHSLGDYTGTWLIVYFYPKDGTSGCTNQACAFRDGREMLADLGAEIVGISKDSAKSHANFAEKNNLNFTLLSDTSTETIKAFGSWQPKKFMGKEFLGINRDTYLIDPKGDIVKKYEGVDPQNNIKDVYADLRKLTGKA
jgi:peroxiredoxin Q/BCP